MSIIRDRFFAQDLTTRGSHEVISLRSSDSTIGPATAGGAAAITMHSDIGMLPEP